MSNPFPLFPESDSWVIEANHPGSGYQVFRIISWKPKMKKDFADIRFHDSQGNIIPHWIDTYTAGYQAKVWLKLTADSIVTLRWGYPFAVSTSSGADVFEYFTDFPGETLPTGLNAANGTWTVANGVCSVSSVDNNTRGVLNVTGAPQDDNYVLRAKYRVTTAGGADSNTAVCVKNTGTFYGYGAGPRVVTGNKVYFVNNYVKYISQPDSLTWAVNAWRTDEIVHDGTNVQYRTADGVWYPWTISGLTGYLGIQNARSGSGTQSTEIDYIAVRKYYTAEPLFKKISNRYTSPFPFEVLRSVTSYYPIISYNEDNEMFQIVGTTKIHPVQIRNLCTGELVTTNPLPTPTFTVSVNGATPTNPTLTYTEFNATLLRHTITVPDTLAVNPYDSVEISVSCDLGDGQTGEGFMLINVVQNPSTFATAAAISELNNISSADVTTATASALSTSNALRILDIIMSGTFTITTGEGGAFTCTYTSRTDLSTIEFSVDGNGQRTAATVTLV